MIFEVTKKEFKIEKARNFYEFQVNETTNFNSLKKFVEREKE